jgi:hypothetical protein
LNTYEKNKYIKIYVQLTTIYIKRKYGKRTP